MGAARLLLAGLAIAALPAAAQQLPKRPPGATAIKRIMAGRYRVDPQRSQVSFTVNQLGFATYRGIFGKVTGSLVIDPKAPRRTLVVIDIPIRNVTTAIKQIDGQLLGPDFFDAARHPIAHFESAAVSPMGRKARIVGSLTLKGVTRPIVLDADLVGAGVLAGKQTVGFQATTTIRRSSFGVSGALPLIPDMVPLAITVVFEMPEDKPQTK